MTAHDKIVQALLEVLDPMGKELRLIARLNDPVIRNSSEKEVFFFVPDLHLLSPDREKKYPDYRFNYSESGLLAKLLARLALLRSQWKQSGAHKLVTIQLGDFLDLWREIPGRLTTAAIPEKTHGELRDLLYRGVTNGKPCLQATMILGNHDTKNGRAMLEIPFQLKAFNRSPDQRPFLFVTHGDLFNFWERYFPDALKEIAVYFAQGAKDPPFSIGEWADKNEKLNPPLSKMKNFIVAKEHTLEEATQRGAIRVTPGAKLPTHLVHVVSNPKDTHKNFAKYYAAISESAKKFPSATGLRVVAVGHSHKAGVLLYNPSNGERPLVLVDVGAWIESCTYKLAEEGNPRVTEPSAQLGVIHGNDIRIYQVRTPS